MQQPASTEVKPSEAADSASQSILTRPTLLLLAGVAVLLVIGVVVAIVAARRPPASFPTNTPQGTVATYLRLLQDGKVDQAYQMTDITFGPPGFGRSRTGFHQEFDPWSRTSHRVTLLRTVVTGSAASVTVQISAFNSNVFGGNEQSSEQTITLQRQHGVWRITGPPYLYP